jgi:hypothetical protein
MCVFCDLLINCDRPYCAMLVLLVRRASFSDIDMEFEEVTV